VVSGAGKSYDPSGFFLKVIMREKFSKKKEVYRLGGHQLNNGDEQR